MRIWKGIEREGFDKGIMTLFVESTVLTNEQLQRVKQCAAEHIINRIYFGAGKQNIVSMSKWADMFRGFKVVVETTYPCLHYLADAEMFNQIIVRMEVSSKISSKIAPKIETEREVLVYGLAIKNSISAVESGIYTDTDTIIYEE